MAAGVGLEAVRPILIFMEAHPGLDYGSPGPLVHFMERFYRAGYEEEVLASVERRPTPHTIWMLNRLANGAKTSEQKATYVAALRAARTHSMTDEITRRDIEDFLKHQDGAN